MWMPIGLFKHLKCIMFLPAVTLFCLCTIMQWSLIELERNVWLKGCYSNSPPFLSKKKLAFVIIPLESPPCADLFQLQECLDVLLNCLSNCFWPHDHHRNNPVNTEIIGGRGHWGQMSRHGTSRQTVLKEDHENIRMQLIMASVYFIAYFCDTQWPLCFFAHGGLKEILLGGKGLSCIIAWHAQLIGQQRFHYVGCSLFYTIFVCHESSSDALTDF